MRTERDDMNEQYKAQCARDAQAMGYGDKTYWNHLEKSAHNHYDYFAQRGDLITAQRMLSRTLSEALRGNEGD